MTERPLHFLLVDDNQVDRFMVAKELARHFPGCRITEARTEADLRAALQVDGFDLAVTDYQLNWGDGIGVLRAVKARTADCPVVMFTASGDQEIAVEAMKSGLDDYIVKSPQHLVRLTAAVRLALERAATRRRAAALEVRLHSLLERLEVGVFRATAAGALVECNRAFLGLLGVETLPDAQALDLSELRRALQETPAAPAEPRELLLRRTDGAEIWVLLSASRSTGPDGGDGIEGIVEDITGRKAMEAELKRRADAMAETARRRDEFLAVMAHELRNPLAPIRNAVYILRQPTATPQTAAAALDVMDRQLRHLTRLIDDLLDISRITRGKITLKRTPQDLNQVVQVAVDTLRSRAETGGLRLTVELAPQPLLVSADVTRLNQIVTCLLDNALKFTAKGGRVEVAVGQESGEAVLRVRDSGAGIPADQLERIFEPFTHVGRTLSTSAQWGMGVGLFLVRKLSEMHGGQVQVCSAGAGQGSEFVVRLPLLPPEPS